MRRCRSRSSARRSWRWCSIARSTSRSAARAGIVTVIASFGVMLMLRSAIQLIWGVDVLTYYEGGIQLPDGIRHAEDRAAPW